MVVVCGTSPCGINLILLTVARHCAFYRVFNSFIVYRVSGVNPTISVTDDIETREVYGSTCLRTLIHILR